MFFKKHTCSLISFSVNYLGNIFPSKTSSPNILTWYVNRFGLASSVAFHSSGNANKPSTYNESYKDSIGCTIFSNKDNKDGVGSNFY